MNLKACELRIMGKQFEELPKIIKVYEKIAKKYLATPILKSSAKDLYFLSCLCYMANEDPIGAKKQMQMYCFDDPTFEGSREQMLVENLIGCMNDKNRDEFAIAVSEFN